jgi:hypothetical protein
MKKQTHRPTKRALRQAAAYWSSQATRCPIRSPKPSDVIGWGDWMETAWNADDFIHNRQWQETADIAASCALSDDAAPRGKRA